MPRLSRDSRRRLTMFILVVVSFALIGMDFLVPVSGRARVIADHLFRPAQRQVRDFAMAMGPGGEPAGFGPDAGERIRRLDVLLGEAETVIAHQAAVIEDLRETRRELELLDERLDGYPLSVVPARVLAHDYIRPNSFKVGVGAGRGIRRGNLVLSRTIARGESEGLRRNQQVISPAGLVGVIEEVSGSASRVKLVTDPDCHLPARVLHWDPDARRWIDVQAVGETRGTADGRHIMLDKIGTDVEVRPGDFVVTVGGRTGDTGFDNLIIGEVVDVAQQDASVTYRITVRPRTDVSRLDRVYVLTPAARR